MKILYTNPHPRNGGGHATYVANLARSLRAEHQVWVATPATSRLYAQASQISGVHCVPKSFSTRLFPMLSETAALRRLLQKHDFDIAHVNGSADHRQLMLACLGMRKPPRIVWTKHNTMPVSSLGHRIRARLGTAGAIGVCDKVTQLLQASPYEKKPCQTIRLGVDLARFSPVNESAKQQARLQYLGALPQDVVVLGSVAGTDADKGWPVVVRAVARLPAGQRQRIRILLAGDPPKERFRQELQQLGLQHQVVFPGLVQDPASVLAASDIGFVFSFHEAGSYAACESLAMGLPTLVSDAGGLPELVQHQVDGWILPAGDTSAVEQWLLSLLSTGFSDRMRSAARGRAETLFSMAQQAANTLSFYQRVQAK